VFRLTSSGVRTLTLRTRLKGKQVRFTYPHAARIENLEDARKWAHTMLDKCQADIDPRDEERAAQREIEASQQLRLGNVVNVFIERHCKKNKSWRDTQAIFRLHVLPRWQDRLITEITRADVARLLDDVEDRTSIYRTNRTLAAIRKLFNWAMSRGMVEHSPVGPGMARAGERSRDRYLTPHEIRAVWKAAEALGYPSGTLVQLLLVTGQRRQEVAGMRWDEIDKNGKLWTLSYDRTKAGRAQIVPLSDLALELIESCPRLGDYVLTTRGDRPVSGFAKWKRHLDGETQRAMVAGKRSGNLTAWRLHDLRRTMATYMEELGIPPHIVGSVLNHSPRGFKGVTSVYTRADLVYERRKALVAWARFLSLLIDRRIGEHMLKLLRPTNEVDALAKDRLQSLLQADPVTWERNRHSILSIATH
jgi:integrase